MKDYSQNLNELYRGVMPELNRIGRLYEGVSGPLLVAVPEGFDQATVRLMIVGQQTYGWPCVSLGLDELLRRYRCFDLGRCYRRSPFWQASHSLYARLNPNGPDRAFVWSNLVKVDQCARRPSPQLEEEVCRLGLLAGELQVVRPDAVVFFTGPYYDERLRQTFAGVELAPLTPDVRDVALLKHPDFPAKAYRTYHPAYLRRAKKWAVLDAIVQHIGGH